MEGFEEDEGGEKEAILGMKCVCFQISNYLFQIHKLNMVLFKLEMIQTKQQIILHRKKKLYN